MSHLSRETSTESSNRSYRKVDRASQTSSAQNKFVDYHFYILRPANVLTKVLESWRSKRYIDPQKIDEVLTSLDSRPTVASSEEPTNNKTSPKFTSSPQQALPRGEVNKRIEQDRERHKRLRERRWVQPTSHNPATFQPPQLATFYPLTEPGDGQEELALDIEFENEWETTSDWNEDDEEAIGEEAELAFPSDDEKPSLRASKIS